MAKLVGLELMQTGTWTDSEGFTTEWTQDDFDTIIANFNRGKPEISPIKLGHTDPEFNQRVATALELPIEALTGDDEGEGAAKLGRITAVRRHGEVLVGDIEILDQLAEMVSQDMFPQRSVELQGSDSGVIISGLGLLGFERPAVKGLADASQATKLTAPINQGAIASFTFSMAPNPKKEVTTMTLEAVDIRKILGLPEDDSSTDEELRAKLETAVIDAGFLANVAEVLGATEEEPATVKAKALTKDLKKFKASTTKAEGSAATFQEELAKQNDRIEVLNQSVRVSHYKELVSPLKIEGSVEELAETLYKTEKAMGQAEADSRFQQFQTQSDLAEKAGLFATIGSGVRGGKEESYSLKFEQFRKDNPDKSEAEAHTAMMKQYPSLYREYTRGADAHEGRVA